MQFYSFAECEKIPIADVFREIGGVYQRRRGKDLPLCPNPGHNDHNAGSVSIVMKGEKNFIHCFSCGYNATPLKLVMDWFGWKGDEGKQKASRYLGEHFGLTPIAGEKKKRETPFFERYIRKSDALLIGLAREDRNGNVLDLTVAPEKIVHEWVDEKEWAAVGVTDHRPVERIISTITIHEQVENIGYHAPLRELWRDDKESYYYIVSLQANRMALVYKNMWDSLKRNDPETAKAMKKDYSKIYKRCVKLHKDNLYKMKWYERRNKEIG